jgi:hypothetical protein
MIRVIKNMFKPFAQWILNNGARQGDIALERMLSLDTKLDSDVYLSDGLTFVVYSAIGGKVIKFSTYDVGQNITMSKLYIVTDKEDLGVEIGQIITRESLSR